jgi:hypothetical protein
MLLGDAGAVIGHGEADDLRAGIREATGRGDADRAPAQAAMRSVPRPEPARIAWIAFWVRLRITCCIIARSSGTSGRSSAMSISTLIWPEKW